MALEAVKEVLDTKIAHGSALGIFAVSWTDYLTIATQVLGVIYLCLLILSTREKYIKNRSDRLKREINTLK